MSNDIRELVAGIRDLSSTLIQNNNSSMDAKVALMYLFEDLWPVLVGYDDTVPFQE